MSYHSHGSQPHNIEHEIRTATVPISSNESEEANALGYRGILLNRGQINSWTGPVPINQYPVNQDPNPEVITKVSGQPVEYNQEIQVRYLRPPTPAPHGDIIIKEQASTVLPQAPPLILRQVPTAPHQPETLIVREHPPAPPASYPQKVITISGKNREPPKRRVIIEKLAPLPTKPQNIIIERWLPFKTQARRVIFEGSRSLTPEQQRNLIVEWQTAPAIVKKKISYLGIVDADPRDYVTKYGPTLTRSTELPTFVNELERIPQEADHSNQLIGDIEALKFLDPDTLEREGLGIYRHYLSGSYGSSFQPISSATVSTDPYSSYGQARPSYY